MATDPPARVRPPLWLSVGPFLGAVWSGLVAAETRDVRAASLTVTLGLVSYGIGALHLIAASRELRRALAAVADATHQRDREAASYRLAAMAAGRPSSSAPGLPVP